MQYKVQRLSKLAPLKLMVRTLLAPILLVAVPASASANALSLLNLQASQFLVAYIQAGSTCVSYVYDANGNRTGQTVATIGSGPTQWGSGTYGCFLWLQ